MLESFEQSEENKPKLKKGPVNAAQFRRLLDSIRIVSPRVSENIPISGIFDLSVREFIIQYWQQIPVEISAYKSLFTETGHLIHRIIQNSLSTAGVIEKTGEEFREIKVYCPETHISGYVDGIISPQRLKNFVNNEELSEWTDKLHLEIKTCSEEKFSSWRDVNYLPDSYKCAATCYQKLLGTELTCFLLVSRDSFTFRTLFYKGEEKYWNLAKNKAKIIWKHVKEHTLPPPGIGEKKLFLDDPAEMKKWVEEIKALQTNRVFRD